ncbi:hypothetical protein ALP82_200129 [Pseudomonas savastanoi pv. fraxini]|uniref:AAA family ATPase n=1 Tax=Pseudomonas savastanoi TaxID=29438 RepID=UPI000F00BD64|nr:AAA family ATPase [Pseudomonas savastanoi]RMR73146.1 hypothetical protein ALP82_200129 [Pseudomonas savastanoi pv. fraxini]
MTSSILYFCGPHGAGKSTAINQLVSRSRYSRGFAFSFQIPETSAYQRASVRAIKYLVEQIENKKAPRPTTVLADRCIYDTLCYINAYQELGWITEDETRRLNEHIDRLFLPHGFPDVLVCMLPDLHVLRERLHCRALDGELRWQHDNVALLQAVHAQYEKLCEELLASDKRILKLMNEPADQQYEHIIDFIQHLQGHH